MKPTRKRVMLSTTSLTLTFFPGEVSRGFGRARDQGTHEAFFTS
jgi:hypothetical protein